MAKMRPFLKWAGGKFKLVDDIVSMLPGNKRTLIEPFLGSGAVFLNTEGYKHYILNDVNCDLITLYKTLQAKGKTFIDDVAPFFSGQFNNEQSYYQMRDQFNASKDPYERSLLLIFLNRHCYNGLMRYNKSRHEFNVPFGRYSRPYYPEDELHAFYEKSSKARFVCEDFQKVMCRARSQSEIYADPPYFPLSDTAKFTSYSADGFDLSDQQRLADTARKMASSGVSVLISNHDTPGTKKLYKGAKRKYIYVRRSISSKATERNKVREVLALFKPPKK
jgi:DNA adenine methylase